MKTLKEMKVSFALINKYFSSQSGTCSRRILDCYLLMLFEMLRKLSPIERSGSSVKNFRSSE